MNTATVTRLQPAHLTLAVDRCADLRRERDEAIKAANFMLAQLDAMKLELAAMRAAKPKPGLIRRMLAWIR